MNFDRHWHRFWRGFWRFLFGVPREMPLTDEDILGIRRREDERRKARARAMVNRDIERRREAYHR